MPTIQSADLWRESGRYDDYGKEMLRIRDRHDRDMLYGPTNEEMITEIFRASVRSYKDLPLNLYHIQWKFRDEVRPRFGVMRSREFLMKDAYSFDLDAAGRAPFLQQDVHRLPAHVRAARPHRDSDASPTPARSAATSATSSSFSPRPARARCSATATISRSRRRPRTSTSTTRRRCRGWSTSGPRSTPPPPTSTTRPPSSGIDPKDSRISARGIEVGHIFYFGTKYSAPMKAVVNGPDGKEHAVHMGSYGIGPTPARRRADRGQSRRGRPDLAARRLAPFDVGLINLKVGDAACDGACARIYASLAQGRRRRAL